MTDWTEKWRISFPEGTQQVAVPKDVQDNAATTDAAITDAQIETTERVLSQVEAELSAMPFGYTLTWDEQPIGHEQGMLATVTGTPDFTQSGKFSTAFTTDGATALATNDSEILITEDMLSGDGITVECWYRATTAGMSGQMKTIFVIGTNHQLVITPAGYPRLEIGTQSNQWIADTSASRLDGQWHHFAGQYRRADGASIIVGLWVDGTPIVGSASRTMAWEPQPRLGIAGKSGTSRDFDLPADSQVDEVRVSIGARYSGAFTPSTAAFALDQDTVILAHLNDATYSYRATGGGYPTRPDVPGGQVLYVGPVQPTTWLENDQWIKAEI